MIFKNKKAKEYALAVSAIVAIVAVVGLVMMFSGSRGGVTGAVLADPGQLPVGDDDFDNDDDNDDIPDAADDDDDDDDDQDDDQDDDVTLSPCEVAINACVGGALTSVVTATFATVDGFGPISPIMVTFPVGTACFTTGTPTPTSVSIDPPGDIFIPELDELAGGFVFDIVGGVCSLFVEI